MALILLVEDEPTIRELSARLLERSGHEVHQATCGQVALDLLAGGLDPDLIILDLIMSGMNGNDVLRHLVESGNRAAVVILSAYLGELEPELREKARFKLAKPVTVVQLLETVDRAIQAGPPPWARRNGLEPV